MQGCILCNADNDDLELLYELVNGQYRYVHRECLLDHGDKSLINQFREYERCPECLYQCHQEGEGDLIRTSKHSTNPYGYYGTEYSWTEHWKCPECGHEWEEDNGT